jgi:hypothetical protein
MPIYSIQAPNGKIYDVEAPEGATERELFSYVNYVIGKEEQPQEVAPPVIEEPKEEDTGFFRAALDVPTGIAKGAVTGVRLITDILGADNPISQNLRGVEDYIDSLYSAHARKNFEEVGRILQEAEDKGIAEQVKAGFQAFLTAPIDTLSQALGTAAPVIAGGLAAGAGRLGAFVTGGMGGAMGAGTAKSSIYEATKEELSKDPNLSEEAIEKAAVQAQAYGGENLDQILLAAGIGTLAARTGFEKAILGKAGVKEAAEEVTKQGAIRTGLEEFGTEAAQAGQEQFAQNLALQRQGFDVPLGRGVVGASAYEGLAGFGLGAGAGAITGREPSAEPVRPAPPTTPETPTPPAPPVSKYEGLSNDEVKKLVKRQVSAIKRDKTLTDEQKNEQITALRLERDQLFEERKKVKVAPAATPTVTDTTTTETITDETLAGETDTETATTETITDETLAGETDTETATTETITDETLAGETDTETATTETITDKTPADETTTTTETVTDTEAEPVSLRGKFFNDEQGKLLAQEYNDIERKRQTLTNLRRTNEKKLKGKYLGPDDALARIDSGELKLDRKSFENEKKQTDVLTKQEDAFSIKQESYFKQRSPGVEVTSREVEGEPLAPTTEEGEAISTGPTTRYVAKEDGTYGPEEVTGPVPVYTLTEKSNNITKLDESGKPVAMNAAQQKVAKDSVAAIYNEARSGLNFSKKDMPLSFLNEKGENNIKNKGVRQVFLKSLAQGVNPARAIELAYLYKNDPKAYTEDFGDPFDLTPKSRDKFALGEKQRKTEKQFTRQTEAVTAIRRRVIDILSRLGLMPEPKLDQNGEMTGEFKQPPLNTLAYPGGVRIDFIPEADWDTLNLPADRDAEYDPKQRIVRVKVLDGEQINFESEQLIHELTHAATVQTLAEYENFLKTGDRGDLTDAQIEASEHLFKIMNALKPRLEGKFPNAFENIYEFVAYGVTDVAFIAELRKFNAPKAIAKYTKGQTSFLKALAQTLLRVLGITDAKGNVALEVAEAFERIVQRPTTKIDMRPLPMKLAPELAARTTDQIRSDLRKEMNSRIPSISTIASGIKDYLTNYGKREKSAVNIVTKYQNEKEELKRIDAFLERIGRAKYDIDNGGNMVGMYMARARSKAADLITRVFDPLQQELVDSIQGYMKFAGIKDIKDALTNLHLYSLAYHDAERRRIKFIKKVPLTEDAGTRRQQIFEVVSFAKDPKGKFLNKKIADYAALWKSDPEAAKQVAKDLRKELDSIVDNPQNYKIDEGKDYRTEPLYNEKSNAYDVLGVSNDQVKAIQTEINAVPGLQRALDDIYLKLEDIKKKTREVNREAAYGSDPVDSIIEFYGWKNYMPYKGKAQKVDSDNDNLDISGARVYGDVAEGAYTMGGRLSDSDNPILQTLIDAKRAGLRVGYRDVAVATENLIKDLGKSVGELEQRIEFADRYNGKEDFKKFGGPKKIFVYNEDGSISVYKINNDRLLKALKGEYQKDSPIVDIANVVTSGMGKMHTRYNPAFAPWDFTRNLMTYTATVALEKGGIEAAKVLSAAARIVASGGMYKIFKLSKLYTEGKLDNARGDNDSYIKAALEYFDESGRVSYVDGLNSRRSLDAVAKDLNSNVMGQSMKNVNKFFDAYMDAFELSSRVAVYMVEKQRLLDKGSSEAQARFRAANYAKEMANFEETGRSGRTIGAWFMFFRPAATGAVRAMKALAPAFNYAGEEEMKNFFKGQAKEYGQELDNATADRMYQDYNSQRKNARVVLGVIMGVGFAAYMLAYLSAGDDDEERNKVGTDDMRRWVRALRINTGIEIGGRDLVAQLSWGFGPGAFASAGSQIAAMVTGNQSFTDGVVNIADAALESFMPVQASRIPPTENPTGFLIDSITPSILKPFVQFTMNVDGLGRRIYPDRQTARYADAYLGTDSVPPMYVEAARWWLDSTGFDMSPNSMYFFANNYLDGLARVVSTSSNLALVAMGNKNFDPRTDTFFLDSYLKAPSNYDATEFKKAEQKIADYAKKINAFKGTPQLSEFMEDNPQAMGVVKSYNKFVNGGLRNLNEAANRVRRSDMTVKEKQDRLNVLRKQQNQLKSAYLNMLDARGFEY